MCYTTNNNKINIHTLTRIVHIVPTYHHTHHYHSTQNCLFGRIGGVSHVVNWWIGRVRFTRQLFVVGTRSTSQLSLLDQLCTFYTTIVRCWDVYHVAVVVVVGSVVYVLHNCSLLGRRARRRCCCCWIGSVRLTRQLFVVGTLSTSQLLLDRLCTFYTIVRCWDVEHVAVAVAVGSVVYV